MNFKNIFKLNNPEAKGSFLGMIAVFVFSFIILSVIFNLGTIINYFNFASGKDEEQKNIELTDLYRQMYGYEARQKSGALNANLINSISDNSVQNVNPIEQLPKAPISNGTVRANTITPVATPASSVSGITNGIYIPKINVKAPIIVSKSVANASILKDLKSGVALYPGTALPGQGNTVIIGHSSSYSITKYASVFSLLNKLVSGDQIIINYNGKNYIYSVTGKKTGSVDVMMQQSITDDLVLGTCWPVGTDKGRILVTASLTN